MSFQNSARMPTGKTRFVEIPHDTFSRLGRFAAPILGHQGTTPAGRYTGGPEKQQPNATAMTTKGAATASSAARNRSYFFLVTAR